MIRVAAVTFVYKSYDFLRKWVAHYGPIFGEENLFVVSHGPDQRHREIAGNCNILSVPREFDSHFDEQRWSFLSQFASSFFVSPQVSLGRVPRSFTGDCSLFRSLRLSISTKTEKTMAK